MPASIANDLHRRRLRYTGPALLAVLALACGSPGGYDSESLPAASSSAGAADAACTAPEGWFASFPPPLPDPDTAPSSNCDFHRWAWQSFFAHVAGPEPLFETWDPPLDFYCAPGTSPAEQCEEDPNVRHFVTPRDLKTNKLSTGEAKPADGQLQLYAYDHGEPPNTLFSSSRINPTWENSITGYTESNLRTPEGFKRFLKSDNNPLFDLGSIEIKASWVLAKNLDLDPKQPPRFFTVKAYAPKGDDPAGCEVVDVALVGYHTVGWTKGHEEDAIWATFEHVDNAPDCTLTPAAEPESGSWSFYTPGTDCKGSPETCNQPQGAPTCDPKNPCREPQADCVKGLCVPHRSATEICRQHPYGGGNAENTDNVRRLNDSVWSQLPEGSVWRNYMLVGTLWTRDGKLPSPTDDPQNSAGSVKLANTTLETFTGLEKGFQGESCFHCHNGGDFADPAEKGVKNLLMSHLVVLPTVVSCPAPPRDPLPGV